MAHMGLPNIRGTCLYKVPLIRSLRHMQPYTPDPQSYGLGFLGFKIILTPKRADSKGQCSLKVTSGRSNSPNVALKHRLCTLNPNPYTLSATCAWSPFTSN